MRTHYPFLLHNWDRYTLEKQKKTFVFRAARISVRLAVEEGRGNRAGVSISFIDHPRTFSQETFFVEDEILGEKGHEYFSGSSSQFGGREKSLLRN